MERERMVSDFAIKPASGRPRILFMDDVGNSKCFGDLERFDTYGFDHDKGYHHVAYGVSMGSNRISPQGNVVVEEDWFDVAHLSLTYYASTDGELERKMFYWTRHRLRTGGIIVVMGSASALIDLTDIMHSQCEHISVRKVNAYGTMFQMAGVVKERQRGYIGDLPPQSRDAMRAQIARSRLNTTSITAFLQNPDSCSFLGYSYQVEQGRERDPGFFTNNLDRRTIGALVADSPLDWLESQMVVDRRKIRVPRALSVGNMAKVAADGQMDGLMEGIDGSRILAKGVTKEVIQQYIDEAEDGSQEVSKLLQHKVFMYWYELTDELPLKFAQLA